MAAVIATPLQRILPAFNVFSLRSTTTSSLLRFAPTLPISLTIPSLAPLLDLLPPFLLAVPKKKVSHSRKAMRSSGKGLKDKTNIVSCPGCGTPKLAHHVCANCYSQISRGYKREAREGLSSKEN